MKKRKVVKKVAKELAPPPPVENETLLYSKAAISALAVKHGYSSSTIVVDDEMLHFILDSIQGELALAVRVAILDADNKGQHSINVRNIDAINRNMKTFISK